MDNDRLEPAGPTETKNWLKCPTYWHLDKTWQPVGMWKPHLALGSAIGVGLNHLLQPSDLDPVMEALDVLRGRYEPNDEWSIEALESMTTKALNEAAKTTVPDILKNEKVLHCELTIGRGRLDLVTKRDSTLIITDHKTSLQMKSEYVLRNLAEAESDWQLWDYAYRAKGYYQTSDIIVRRHLGVLTPRTKWYLQEYNIKPEVLERWGEGATEIWNQIERGRRTIEIEGDPGSLPMNLNECHNRYGKCSFYDACHKFNQDPALMQAFYTKRGK